MAKKRATEEVMGEVHETLAQTYLRILREGDPEKCTPAFLTSAAKFLKDNGIEIVPNTGSTVDEVADLIPVFEDDEHDVRH